MAEIGPEFHNKWKISSKKYHQNMENVTKGSGYISIFSDIATRLPVYYTNTILVLWRRHTPGLASIV